MEGSRHLTHEGVTSPYGGNQAKSQVSPTDSMPHAYDPETEARLASEFSPADPAHVEAELEARVSDAIYHPQRPEPRAEGEA